MAAAHLYSWRVGAAGDSGETLKDRYVFAHVGDSCGKAFVPWYAGEAACAVGVVFKLLETAGQLIELLSNKLKALLCGKVFGCGQAGHSSQSRGNFRGGIIISL